MVAQLTDWQTPAQILEALATVMDPEVPVLSVVELGVVRDVNVALDDDGAPHVHVALTPTYSGCPALKAMQDAIEAKINEIGFERVTVTIVYAPAWTTDWMSDLARARLKSYGIAPPRPNCRACASADPFAEEDEVIPCPRCNSRQTTLQSLFGATSCKALYTCDACKEPFEYFKAF